ncbi:MAG: PDZ domain-containing protein [Bacteroidota bacterium]
MKYRLQYTAPYEKWIDVQISVSTEGGMLTLCLPHWRPGRYELQNYARYFSDLWAMTNTGEPVQIRKSASHSWEFRVEKATDLTINYRYFADQTDAGGSYVDQKGIYVNGINCFLYQAGKEEEACELTLDLPEEFVIGGGLPGEGPTYQFENFHQLVDTPFVASKDLIHHQFDLKGIPTHLWFMGFCKPDFARIETDFLNYSQAQLDMFGEFPVSEYHYLFLMLPNHFRHGVEHYNSTVITMGPGHRLMRSDFYKSFLEISSHELFHTWNVKALRPADMFPYDYSKENYSRLHYITEGVTTYYGDLMIWKGGGWTLDQWVQSINNELNIFFRMGGQKFISLESASFDSWVNGYKKTGAPNRKISFYTKGYLVAMLLDLEIRKGTNNQHSLDDVIHAMYHRIAKQGRGYTGEEYQQIAEEFFGKSLNSFFTAFVSGVESLEAALSDMAQFYGFNMLMLESNSTAEARWGMKLGSGSKGETIVENLWPESPALQAGISYGDELISIGGRKVEGNADELLQFFADSPEILIFFFHDKELFRTVLRPSEFAWKIPQFVIRADPTDTQARNLEKWKEVGGAAKDKQEVGSNMSQS